MNKRVAVDEANALDGSMETHSLRIKEDEERRVSQRFVLFEPKRKKITSAKLILCI